MTLFNYTPLSFKRPLSHIHPPWQLFSKILGNSERIRIIQYSVSCLINKGLRTASCLMLIQSKDRLTMTTLSIKRPLIDPPKINYEVIYRIQVCVSTVISIHVNSCTITDHFQVSSIASSLSTRQLLRIARRLATYQAEDLEHSIQKACLARYTASLASS